MISKRTIKSMPREEWLRIRKDGIGGSDAGAILGLNPYKTAFEVYADKLSLIPPKDDTEAMRQGRDLEEYVAKRFEEETGKKVRRENNILYNSDYPFAFANIDRSVIGERAGLECKTTKCLNLKRYRNGDFPSEYYCQCMHYMMVTGFTKWYLAVLVFGREFKIFEIERDEEEIASLAKFEENFWKNHVLAKQPPEPVGSENEDRAINTIFAEANGEEIDLTVYDRELAELMQTKKIISEYERKKRSLEEKIKLFMKEASEGRTGKYRVTWKEQSRRTWDISELAALLPPKTDLAKYYKDTSYRVFKVTEGE